MADDSMERQINVEQQRMVMQDLLRNANMAIMVAVNEKGQILSAYLNCSPIELIGLSQVMVNHVQGFGMEFLDPDDDDDD
jgi:uncharacterized protein YunC (DUF1805 family)